MSEVVLVIDIGGTKTLAAHVQGQDILHAKEAPTPRMGGADAILDCAYHLAKSLPEAEPSALAAAVTGGVTAAGEWFALNEETLDIPSHYPLPKELQMRFGLPPLAVNDAQAAAFGEYAYGAGAGQDCVFLTVSTGLGGGVIANGSLVKGHSGLAGHFGIMKFAQGAPVESRISGQFMAREAAQHGHRVSAKEVFEAALTGADWAETILATSAQNLADVISDLALAFDPPVFVIGGSIGLADGYIPRLEAFLSQRDLPIGVLRPAKLGKYAPAIGAAALVGQHFNTRISTNEVNHV